MSRAWLDRKADQVVEWLDRRWRRLDWQWSRLFWRDADPERDPPWSIPPRAWRSYGISGHPRWLFVLPLILLAAVVLGPTLELDHPGRRTAAAAWVLIAVVVLKLCEHLRWSERFGFHAQAGLLGAAAAFVYFTANPSTREADPDLYPNVLLLIVTVTLVCSVLAALIAFRLVRAHRGVLRDTLAETDLFRERKRDGTEARSALYAFAVVPFVRPLALLFAASLFSLTALGLGEEYFRTGFWLGIFVAWAALGTASMSPRCDEPLNRLGRLFFGGPQIVVSAAVVALAVLRLNEVSYITYLFNTGDRSLNPTITAYVATAYAVCWFYGYWHDRFLGVQLLKLFSAEPPTQADRLARVRYARPDTTGVPTEHRYLQLHGGGLFAVCEQHPTPDASSGVTFDVYTPHGLLERMEGGLANRPERARESATLRLLRQRMRFYAVAVNAMFFFTIAGIWWFQEHLPQRAQLLLDPNKSRPAVARSFDLKGTLTGAAAGPCGAPLPAGAPRIALAASGGGTRAAMYTTSLLRAFSEHGYICNLVLASGVSGGSAALAYLGENQDELFTGSQSKEQWNLRSKSAWKRMSTTMTEPFILDVLDGLSELRFSVGEPQEAYAGAPPIRMRINNGHLLEESFDRHFIAGSGRKVQLGQVRLGLIFNTSLAGAFPYLPEKITRAGILDGELKVCDGDTQEACLASCGANLPQQDSRCGQLRSNEASGGRLVMTNLRPDAFGSGTDTADLDGVLRHPRSLPLTVVDRAEIPLTAAASLSANFPPVFADAVIDVYGRDRDGVSDDHRWWVTDGGAVENRGTVTMLLALREAVKAMTADERNALRLHVVVADASSGSGGYRQDRGVNTLLGAGAQLGRQLEAALFDEIKSLLAENGGQGKIEFYDLPMPNVFRTAGIGTHWMLPNSVTFRRPFGVPPDLAESGEVTLCKEALQEYVVSIHVDQPDRTHEIAPCPSSGLMSAIDLLRPAHAQETWRKGIETLRRWIKEDGNDNHPRAWRRLRDCLDGDQTACERSERIANGTDGRTRHVRQAVVEAEADPATGRVSGTPVRQP